LPAVRDELAHARDASAGSVAVEGGGKSFPTLGGGVVILRPSDQESAGAAVRVISRLNREP
jgi:hypothetical protein